MTNFYLFVFAFILFGCNHPESSNFKRYKEADFKEENKSASTVESIGYKVIGIKDGDTFVILIDGKEQVVRLEHVYCTEKKATIWNKSKTICI
jgi:endonuclease YncB( thermonuclease family)